MGTNLIAFLFIYTVIAVIVGVIVGIVIANMGRSKDKHD